MKKLFFFFFFNFMSLVSLAMESNSNDVEQIAQAIRTGADLNTIKELVSPDITVINKVTSKGQSLLAQAVLLKRVDVVKFFLEYDDLLVNRCDSFMGYTELHYAAFKGYDQIIQLLIDHGGWQIDLPTNSSLSLTALDLANQSNYYECCEILLANNAKQS